MSMKKEGEMAKGGKRKAGTKMRNEKLRKARKKTIFMNIWCLFN